MLSRQFNVLVTDEDMFEIETVLRRRDDVQFLSSTTNEARTSLLPIKSLRLEGSPPGPTRRRCFLAPVVGEAHVNIEPVSDVKVHIALEASDLVEFWRSYCGNGEIQKSRVYYTARFYDDEGYHEKSPDFVRWAERTVSAVKRVLNYDRQLGAQVGPDAAQKIASGALRVIP